MYKTEQQKIKMHYLHSNLFFSTVDKNQIHFRQKPNDRKVTLWSFLFFFNIQKKAKEKKNDFQVRRKEKMKLNSFIYLFFYILFNNDDEQNKNVGV